MASQNLNVGTAANANNGDTLRAAFINVRKMFHEIYGISATYSDSLDLSTGGETFAESVQDIIGGMVSGNTENNIQVTYDDTNNKLNFTVAADINDINTEANSGLSGGVDSGDATLTLDLNNLSAAVVDVGTDSIAIVDASDSNNTKKESIADFVTAITDNGLNASNGLLSVDVDDTTVEFDITNGIQLKNDGISQAKLGDEFTTREAISASVVDFSSAAVFTKTISAATTLTFSNVTTGAVKTLIINGDASLALTGVTSLNGTYSGTATKNVIQIISTNGSSEMFATISNVT